MKSADKPTYSKKKKIIRISAKVLVVAAVFALGLGIGNGRIRIGFLHSLRSEQKNLPGALDYTSVNEVYNTLKTDFDGQLDKNKLLDGLKAGLVNSSGDPYTEYMNSDEAKQFNEGLTGKFSGIGAELSKDNSSIIVVSPLAGFPAEKAGLKSKDVITEIDGKSAYDISLSDAVNRIRGPKGTTVQLKILRNNKDALTLSIQRDDITIPSVTTKTLDGNIGYIQISRFGDDTSDLATQAATKFKNDNVKGIILDLRGDPGGLLTAAVNVSSLWLNNKQVLTERRDNQIIREYDSTGTPILAGIPTIVLIDDGSASASEITAGALHDNGAATLVGVKSFGKGSVQQLEQLTGGGVLKVTIARWYTPKGRNIDKEGIEPDKKVTTSDDDIKAGKDLQLEAALSLLKK